MLITHAEKTRKGYFLQLELFTFLKKWSAVLSNIISLQFCAENLPTYKYIIDKLDFEHDMEVIEMQ